LHKQVIKKSLNDFFRYYFGRFNFAAMKKTKIVKISVSLVLATSFIIAGIFDYKRGKDKRIIINHRNDHHPVINKLFARKIRQDQPLGELLSNDAPSRFFRPLRLNRRQYS